MKEKTAVVQILVDQWFVEKKKGVWAKFHTCLELYRLGLIINVVQKKCRESTQKSPLLPKLSTNL